MKLLILLSRYPYPLEKGDKLRAYNQIKELSKNNEIILFALSDKNIPQESIEALKPYCISINYVKLTKISIIINLIKAYFNDKPFQIGYFYNSKAQKRVNELISEHKPDHIYCQLVRVAEYVKNIKSIPKTIDYMDALSKGIQRRISKKTLSITNILKKIEYKRLAIYEREVFNCFDNKTIISEQDRECIIHPNKNEISIIKNGVNTDFFKPIEVKKTYDLIFTGNMNYPPNIKGAIFIANKILPIVLKKYPDFKVAIAGAQPALSVKSLQSKNIEITGWVNDIRDCYAASKIFIAPMQIGIGLQNKLLEAMAMKLPCIASELTNNSLAAEIDKEILIGNTPQDYANHIFSLMENSAKRNQLAQNGYNFIHRNYNWESITSKLNDIISNK